MAAVLESSVSIKPPIGIHGNWFTCCMCFLHNKLLHSLLGCQGKTISPKHSINLTNQATSHRSQFHMKLYYYMVCRYIIIGIKSKVIKMFTQYCHINLQSCRQIFKIRWYSWTDSVLANTVFRQRTDLGQYKEPVHLLFISKYLRF